MQPKNAATLQPGDQPHLVSAFADIGLKETPGAGTTPRIAEAYSAAGHPTPYELDDDKWSWCSAMMNLWFVENGLRSTQSLMGRSWLTLKGAAKLDKDELLPRGAVAVFKYNDNPAQGHVAIILEDQGERLLVIGANQRNSVCTMTWSRDLLIGAVWPGDVPMVGDDAPAEGEPVPLPRARPQLEEPGPTKPARQAPPPDERADEDPAPAGPSSIGALLKARVKGLVAGGTGTGAGLGLLGYLTDPWAVVAFVGLAAAILILFAVLLIRFMGAENARAWIRRQFQ